MRFDRPVWISLESERSECAFSRRWVVEARVRVDVVRLVEVERMQASMLRRARREGMGESDGGRGGAEGVKEA